MQDFCRSATTGPAVRQEGLGCSPCPRSFQRCSKGLSSGICAGHSSSSTPTFEPQPCLHGAYLHHYAGTAGTSLLVPKVQMCASRFMATALRRTSYGNDVRVSTSFFYILYIKAKCMTR